jgi:hypothetical protein
MTTILDFFNHDIGLKILFPEADYFFFKEEIDRQHLYDYYGFSPILFTDGIITSEKYDTLFVIATLYDSCENYMGCHKESFYEATQSYFNKTIEIIKNNNFKRVVIFDNYDYDYDPNDIFISNGVSDIVSEKNIIFFKRYMNKTKQYRSNVYPFPYLIFGYQCNIHMLLTRVNYTSYSFDRIYFSGNLLHHIDPVYNIERNRYEIFHKIWNKFGNYFETFYSPHDEYMIEMAKSKYCLDLLGVGDPNIRTFEILSCGSLRIAQRSLLTWNFPEDFCEETYFDNEDDLYDKITLLNSDDTLYQKCLDRQNHIVSTYMNKQVLREYITNIV